LRRAEIVILGFADRQQAEGKQIQSLVIPVLLARTKLPPP
jgi:hypothetical protein